jgi:hypothetical protein
MKPEEFISFDKQEPEEHKHIIVTNNIGAKNFYGEMSHVWLVTFWTHTKDRGIITFDEGDKPILHITHWKYA